MITITEATQIVLDHTLNLPTETVPIQQAMGRLLQEELDADRDFPPFDRVSMDGIGIAYAAFEAGQRTFKVEGIAPAGAPQLQLSNPANCVEIMTGAVMAAGADTVIRYEDVVIEEGMATIQVDTLKPGQNVHKKGLDRKAGSRIIPRGKMITPAEIGVAATVGKSHLQVLQQPKAIILSSGDELVDIEDTPLPHQIRKSNVHAIRSVFHTWGIDADIMHLPDEAASIKAKLADIITSYHVVVMSGGVSKGKYDYIPEVLEQLAVKKLFHKVKQRPGKPFWFGKAPTGAVIFALPGNPVSSFMCTHRYVHPWLRKSMGLPPFEDMYAVLQEAVTFKPDLTYLMQVRLSFSEQGQLQATPYHGHGSGDLANLTETDAFMEIPQGREVFSAGEVFRVYRFRG
jgi:molybdopterin molybdotransferase